MSTAIPQADLSEGSAAILAQTPVQPPSPQSVEDALRASEESYRTLFNLASDALFVHDPVTGAVLDANQYACEIYGCSLKDLRTRGLDIIGHPTSSFTREKALEYIRLAAAGEPQRFEWQVNGADGEPVWSEVTLHRISVLGHDRVIASLRDIRERKAAEEARHQAERKTQEMANRMRAVAGAAAGVIGAETGAELLSVLRDACRQVIPLEVFSLGFYNEADHTLYFPGVYDGDLFVPAATFAVAGTPGEQVVRTRRSLVTHRSDAPEGAGAFVVGTGRRSESIIRTPILSGERVLGLIMVQSYTPDLYTPEDVEVLEAVAALTATAMLNMELLEELRASEESYRTIFEASGDAIYVLDKDTGAILDVNRAACELNGYPPEQMKALGIGGLSYHRPPHNWENAQELIRRAAAGEPQRVDWLARHSSGRDVWGEVTLQRVTVLGQDRVLATARNITERKAAEEARREAEQHAQNMASRMRAVAGAASGVIGACCVDELLPILRDACQQVISLDAFFLSLYRKADHSFSYAGYDAGIPIPTTKVTASGTPSERVISTRRSLVTHHSDDPHAAGAIRLGTHRRSESIIRTPILQGDRVLGVISVQSYTPELYTEQDVEVLEAIASLASTALLNLELLEEREAAVVALSESEGKFKALFEDSPDATFLLDGRVFIDCNQAAVDLLRCASKDQIIGRHPAELSAGFQADGAESYGKADAIMSTAFAKGSFVFEWLIRRADGEEFPAEVAITAYPLQDTQVLHVVARDITARKQTEEALLRANEELELRVAERTADLARANSALEAEVAQHEIARAELQQRTEELEAVFRALPDIYFRFDSQGIIRECRSGSGEDLFVPPEQLLNRALDEVFSPEMYETYVSTFDEVKRTGQMLSLEYDLPFPEGSRDYEARMVPLEDGSVIAIVRNMTDRKGAERELQRREEHFRRLIENAHDLVMVIDEAANIGYVSPSVERILGFSQAELIGTAGFELVHPDDIEIAQQGLGRTVEVPGAVSVTELRLRHRDGGFRLVESVARTLSSTTAEQGIVINVRDTTEQREAERALQEREEHFRRLIETSHDLVQTLDAEGRIVYTGPSVERLLGYTPEEIAGSGAPEFIHPDDQPRVESRIIEALSNPGQPINSEYRVLHKDGHWRWFEAIARTLSSDTAEHGIVANARDVTERRLAEEALAHAKEEAERAREAAERANRAKSEFLSRMSHELRTPMNSILGFGQLLSRASLPPQQDKSVQHILKAGRHLLSLINEVLEIARIEAGRQNFSLEPVRIGNVLQETIGLVRPLAAQWGVEIDEVADTHGSTFVYADRQRLVQVLLNVVSNAIKYNRPGGRVRVSCVKVPGEAGYNRLCVRIRDTGRGIPADRQDQLFTPFARLGAEQTEVEGTGLGLALSQRLAEAMGGTLLLEHSSPEGSTFRLDLQVAEDPVAALEKPVVPAPPLEGVSHRDATLLYIEDNLANLSLVETILLTRPKWKTLPALQGQLGVELANEHLPDLILLDLHLPDIHGEEVLRRLRRNPRTAGIPVVIISADATSGSVDRLRIAGADAYLTKPLDVDEFLETVERFLKEAG